MCGIVGFASASFEDSRDCLKRMSDAISHRGPDDDGAWFEDEAALAFGFRRLSILDLTKEGHQPMTSSSKRFVIVFNGEIYNFNLLRKELEKEGAAFRGRSDTEVMLASFERWGVVEATKKFDGMFAFAVWDAAERTLWLGRDPVGEKPLYYGWNGGSFYFASELKGICAHPAVSLTIDRSALSLFARHSCVPAPYSIYEGIFKLEPGALLKLPEANLRTPLGGEKVIYFSARDAAEAGARKPFSQSFESAVEILHEMLLHTVKSRMVSDVPLGAFLSGGIDSSTVVALMQASSTSRVKTFSIGFRDERYNEAPYGARVAQHLGTEHTEMYVTGQEALEVVQTLPVIYDEPFSDSSQIPTYLVAGLARKHVTVSLSGDAGDELFGGYDRYALAEKLQRALRWIPLPLRSSLALILENAPIGILNSIFCLSKGILPERFRSLDAGRKFEHLARVLRTKNFEGMYREMVSHWSSGMNVVKGVNELSYTLNSPERWPRGLERLSLLRFLDLVCYLPDDILQKVDRASMAVSLESRVPFLSKEIIEFAFSLPREFLTDGRKGKRILREVLKQYVPEVLIDRPKMGFGVPIHEWLRTDLKEWGESLLSEKLLREDGFFEPALVRAKWKEHQSGAVNWHYYLWDILMFQAWLHRS